MNSPRSILWRTFGVVTVALGLTSLTMVGLAEVYVGMAVLSRRHASLALLWLAITIVLNALIVLLSVSGLEALPLGRSSPPAPYGSHGELDSAVPPEE